MKKTFIAITLVLGAVHAAPAKDLVVYFSVTDTTAKLANVVHDAVGGDIVRIQPVNEYPAAADEHTKLTDMAKAERDTDARPAFRDLGVDLSEYDTIYVGYPIWWYTLPMIMYTFFDTYDFDGKTIVPFNTHGGSGDGGTYETIRGWEPNAVVLNGLPVSRSVIDQDQTETVKSWLESIGK